MGRWLERLKLGLVRNNDSNIARTGHVMVVCVWVGVNVGMWVGVEVCMLVGGWGVCAQRSPSMASRPMQSASNSQLPQYPNV